MCMLYDASDTQPSPALTLAVNCHIFPVFPPGIKRRR